MASLALTRDETIPSLGLPSLSRVADDELLRQLDSALATQRKQLARLLLLLGEVEERRIHLSRGYPSLFDFCTTALHFSEGEAFRRIAAARLARRFPVVLGLIARGEIHLTGLVLLREHLTDDNHAELLAAARYRSKRGIQGLVAERFPRPDVKCSVRKLPAPRVKGARTPEPWTPDTPNGPTTSAAPIEPASAPTLDANANLPPPLGGSSPSEGSSAPLGSKAASDVSSAPPQSGDGKGHARPSHRDVAMSSSGDVVPRQDLAASRPPPPGSARVELLSPARFRVQFTAGQGFKDKLDRARELLAHSCPHGDLAVILERALDALLVELERSRRAKTKSAKAGTAKPNPVAPPNPAAPSAPPHAEGDFRSIALGPAPLPSSSAPPGFAAPRASFTASSAGRQEQRLSVGNREPSAVKLNRTAIPRAVRRAVFARDGERCTFVGPNGQRCTSCTFLELDHVHPHALGGSHTPENLRVLCRAHNRLLAERTFGREHIERRLRQRKSESTSSVACASASPRAHRAELAPARVDGYPHGPR